MNYDGLNHITIQQLESFYYLVQERSFTRAAKKMRLTQPALTKHIKNVENAIGVKIILRKTSGVTLTPEGIILLEYARKVIGFRETLKEKFIRSYENEIGSVTVAASTIPATYILPYKLGSFNKQFPDIRIFVKNANSDEAIDIILNNQAEIGFTGKQPKHKKIYAESIWKDRLILVVPQQMKTPPCISSDELMKLPFIIREKGSGTRQIVEEYIMEKIGIHPHFNIAAELGSSESIKEAVIAGMGASIISVHAVRRELEQNLVAELQIEDWKIERDFFLIYKKKFDLMRHHQAFLSFIRQGV